MDVLTHATEPSIMTLRNPGTGEFKTLLLPEAGKGRA